jgi:hypothetical protein
MKNLFVSVSIICALTSCNKHKTCTQQFSAEIQRIDASSWEIIDTVTQSGKFFVVTEIEKGTYYSTGLSGDVFTTVLKNNVWDDTIWINNTTYGAQKALSVTVLSRRKCQ